MGLAIYNEELIRLRHVSDFTELARLGHVASARVTHIMNLRLQAPDIQEELLAPPTVQSDRAKLH
jgi:hypothetical protein